MKKIFLCAIALVIAIFSAKSQSVKTLENLKAGIKGETTASAKYAAFAQKAREEGFNNIAKLFEAASKSESIHASNHRKVLEEMNGKMEDFKPEFQVKSTAENLQAAIDGETYEIQEMYPAFIKDAREEKVPKALKSYNWANDTEKKHAEFYIAALKALQSGNEKTVASKYAICPMCGNTYEGDKIEAKCSFCQTDKGQYIIIS
jgi:rubrerythrin